MRVLSVCFYSLVFGFHVDLSDQRERICSAVALATIGPSAQPTAEGQGLEP